jgi:hypothetical protein
MAASMETWKALMVSLIASLDAVQFGQPIGAATVGYVGVRTPTKIVRQLTDTHEFCFVPPALWPQVDVWTPTLFRTLLRHWGNPTFGKGL